MPSSSTTARHPHPRCGTLAKLPVVAACLFLLHATASLTPTKAQGVISLETPTPRSPGHFGGAVAGLPDINGDGHGDLLVGADWEGGLAGRAHLFSGATGELIRTLQSPTPAANGVFGIAVAYVPDVDGDGSPDVVIGSREGTTATGQGRAHVFSGSSGDLVYSLASPLPFVPGRATSFGAALAGLADIDGDNRGELLVGEYSAEGSGRAYLFSGASGDTLRSFRSPNPETNGSFGIAVDGVPDADGDGVVDVVVTAHLEDASASNAGRAYLFSGATGALLHTFVSPNASTSGLFGRSVKGVPDTDGDSRGDVLVGASRDLASGRAYLFSGATGSLLHTFESPTPASGALFGGAVGVTADLDGDTIADVVVGATGEVDGATVAGRVHVFSGATGLLISSLGSANPVSSGFFGYSVSGVPDADADGRGDILVGAVQENGSASQTGRAYLFPGSTGVSNEAEAPVSAPVVDVYPNPADAEALIRFTLSHPESYLVVIHDVLGREVARVHDGVLTSGVVDLRVNASLLPSGLYFVVAATTSDVITKRLVLAR